MRQVKLKSGDTETVAWVDKEVRSGNIVTLKHEPDRLWEVLWVGTVEDAMPERGWRVGGIESPLI
jgi:hypothetical protein